MGVKRTSRLLAVFVALALMMTSAVSVFAADSPTKGSTTPTSVTVTSNTSISVTTSASTVKYRVKGGKWKTATVTNGTVNLTGLKKHKNYEVKIGDKSYYRITCKTSIKSAKKKGKTVTVKWTKKKCAKKYVVTAVRASDGKVVKKTVKSRSAKLKLASGTWKITVTEKNGKYTSRASAAKTVTIG